MPPLRSCSQNEKPPCVPRPGIDGGMTANAVASGTCVAQLRVQPIRRSRAPRAPRPSRSSHGFRPTK